MAKYVQPVFIVDSSSSFLGQTEFKSATTFIDSVKFDSSVNFGGQEYESFGTMAVEDTSSYTTKINLDTSLASIDASITRLDASLNDVIDISEIIDSSIAAKVDRSGDTMTGLLTFDASGFGLDSVVITTIDTSSNGLSELDTAIPTSGLMKSYVDESITTSSTEAWNGLSKSDDGSIGLGGIVSESVTLTPDNSTLGISYGEPAAPFAHMWVNSYQIELFNESTSVKFAMTPDGSMVVSNALESVNFQGIKYANDLSTNFIDRSLVDKGYVDAKISSEGFVLSNGSGTTANGTSVDLGGTLTGDTNIDVSGNVLSITGELSIYGNLTVDGSTTTVNSVNLDVSDNIITINAGETGAGVSKGFAGLKVDRGTADDYVFVFQESNDTFRIGIENEASLGGNTQAVATREDTPIAAGISFWNDTQDRIDTALGFTYHAVNGLSLGVLQPNDNSSNKALVSDASGLIGYRTLGSNAYTSIEYATQTDMDIVDVSITTLDASVEQLYVDASTQAGKYKGTFNGTSGTSVTITAATHSQGTGPFIVSVFEDSIQIIPEISFNGSGDITIDWTSGSLSANCSYLIVG